MELYTKEEINMLLEKQKKDIRLIIQKQIKQAEFDKLPKYLPTGVMANLLGIKGDTLRARQKKKYKFGEHFIKKNGRILWDKYALLGERYEIF